MKTERGPADDFRLASAKRRNNLAEGQVMRGRQLYGARRETARKDRETPVDSARAEKQIHSFATDELAGTGLARNDHREILTDRKKRDLT